MEEESDSSIRDSSHKRQKRESPPSPPFRLYRIRSGKQTDVNSLETDIQSWFEDVPEYAFLSNFMIDLDWLISAVPGFTQIPEAVIVHGEGNDHHLRNSLLQNNLTHFTLYRPPLPIPFGTHHSKAFILKYPDGLRIIIHTANLIYADCGNKTQGAWIQDFPHKNTTSERSKFEADLIRYIQRLNLPKRSHSQLVEIIEEHDFSLARGKLIYSVPGYHKGPEMTKYGHLQLKQCLRSEVFPETFKQSPVVCQFSSLGSLDPKWLFNELLVSFCEGKGSDGAPLGATNELKLVWPTITQVKNSREGWLAGLSIPGSSKNVSKSFLQPLWHKFDGTGIDREHEMPHIKTYARYANSMCSWVLLTSHNLSKAAWGTLQKKDTQFMIRSYELGVLFLPSLEAKYWSSSNCHFSCTQSCPAVQYHSIPKSFNFLRTRLRRNVDDGLEGIECPLPFTLPPSPYSPEDEPWISDVPQAGVDSLGKSWGRPAAFYGMKEESE
eukprot:g1032.t1